MAEGEAVDALTVHLAPGTYDTPGALGRNISLQGAGDTETVIVGTVRVLSSRSRLSALTVTGGADGGVIVMTRSPDAEGTDVEVRDVVIHENDGPGVFVARCGQRTTTRLVNCVVRDNRGPGVKSRDGASVILESCTIARNLPLRSNLELASAGCSIPIQVAGGVVAEDAVTIESSIIWGNAGRAVRASRTANVRYSLIEGGYVGEGNIDADPRFCGWPLGLEVDIDSQFRNLRDVIDPAAFHLSLRSDSPCLGAGQNGSDMGAALGICPETGLPSLRVRLGPGRYSVDALGLQDVMSLEGAGADETILEGTISGLRTGAVMSGVTVTGRLQIVGAAPRIESVVVEGSDGPGVLCLDGAAPEFIRCVVQRNRASPNAEWAGGVVAQGRTSHPVLISCVIRDNEGPGVWCTDGSAVTLERCTVAGNRSSPCWDGLCEGGIRIDPESSVSISNSVVWNNTGGSIVELPRSKVAVSFSSIEGGWIGTGNIDGDPRFCGWPEPEVFVDERLQEHGLHRDLASAIDPALFSLALAADSPCRGTGLDGTTMGADLGVCDRPATSARLVHLAPGRYPLEGSLMLGVSISGPVDGLAVIDGTVRGLRRGSVLERVTVMSKEPVTIVVGPGEAPVLRRCFVAGSDGNEIGIYCGERSAPRIESSIIVGYEFGIYCESATPTIVNTIVAKSRRRAVDARGSSHATLIHCTVVAGVDAQSIGGVGPDTVVTVKNSVVVGAPSVQGAGQLSADHSLIQLDDPGIVWPGEGNLNADPRFVDPDQGDYRLLPNSPGIDVAQSSAEVSEDIDGFARPCGPGPDMGAYEMGDCLEKETSLRFLRGDCNTDGEANVTDAVCIL